MFKQLSTKLKDLFSRITVKQIALIIIFGLIISVASCIIGYSEFSTTIKDTYNKQVTEMAKLVSYNIDVPEFEQDMKNLADKFYYEDNPEFEKISKQPGYQSLISQMQKLENSVEGIEIIIGNYEEQYNANYLNYLKTPKSESDKTALEELQTDTGDTLVSYYRSSNLVPASRKKNEPGGCFLISDQERESLLKLYETKTAQYHDTEIVDSETNATANTFSVDYPLFNDRGDMVGMVSVSITINVLHTLLTRYLMLVGCLTILIGVIFILIYIHINRRMFINPILSIIQGTSSFVENNNQITKSLEEIKTGDEIQTLAESILKLENDINVYIRDLAAATKERERVQAELDLATNIQMSMLPEEIPEISKRDEFEISAIMNPAREVGGDFYNYFLIDDDHLGFVVGDVSGKGVPAALFMMIGTILIKTESLPDEAVNEIIEKVNDILSENNAEMLFITAWMGIYEISTGTVKFINAGHEPPVLVHENGEYEFVKTKPNLALATFGGIPYMEREIKLQKGDKIFLYTDGVAEARNVEGDFYKMERFAEVVQKNYKKNLDEIVKIAREEVDIFAGEAEQFDDITIFGLEVKKEPKN